MLCLCCARIFVYIYINMFYHFTIRLFDIKTHLFTVRLPWKTCTFQTLPKAGRWTKTRHIGTTQKLSRPTAILWLFMAVLITTCQKQRSHNRERLLNSLDLVSYLVSGGRFREKTAKRCPSRAVSSSVSLWIASKKYLGIVAFKYNYVFSLFAISKNEKS